MGYFQYYMMGIIILPALLVAIYAQSRVSYTYDKYRNLRPKNMITAAQMARAVLDAAGLNDVSIRMIPGRLTDNYNPATRTLSLSQAVYEGCDVASIGIACHEVGHAIQFARGYVPARVRQVVIPICNFASAFLWPLVMLGLMFNFAAMPGSIVGDILLWSGIGLFGASVLVNLLTLFSEFNASHRALKILSNGYLEGEELAGAKSVLSAAALTYVAALLVSVLELVRFLLVIFMGSRRE